MSVVLGANDISIESLLALFQAAGLSAVVDDDGDIDITRDGIRTFVRLDDDRKIMSLFSIWQLADDASLEDRVELANSLNVNIVLVRFCIRADGALWCDHQLVYGGGLTPESILRTYALFVEVCEAVGDEHEMIV
ncbi:MAG TPA: hypothetical protein DGT21_20010 [Armatimonadetes bacterium]|nr:hypothetical protein [Armatimonadota bacterium]